MQEGCRGFCGDFSSFDGGFWGVTGADICLCFHLRKPRMGFPRSPYAPRVLPVHRKIKSFTRKSSIFVKNSNEKFRKPLAFQGELCYNI